MKTKLTNNTRSFLLKTALLFTLLIAIISTASATHYRYGNISWSRNTDASTDRTVTFKINMAWRNTAFGGVSLGATVSTGSVLSYGDATSANINVVVTSINVAEDWFYGTATLTHTYAGSATHFLASYSSCCRISTLSNNSDGSFMSSTSVDLVSGNTGSPVSTMTPIINAPTGQSGYTFAIPASDPDGGTLTFSSGTSALFEGGSGWSQASGFSVSSTGTGTFVTTSKAVGSLWNVGVLVTDAKGSTSMVDFIIKIVTANTPPIFDYSVTPADGSTFSMNPGACLVKTFKALDVDAGSIVKISAVGLPTSNISFSPTLPTGYANPISTTMTFCPVSSQLGTYVITFTAERDGGAQVQTSITINVNTNPEFISPTPLEGVSYVIPTNTLESATISAKNPDASVKTKLISATIPSGASMSPSIPTSFATTATSDFTWTPTEADWGPHTLIFKAEDENGKTVTRTYELIPNSLPEFTSTPITTAYAGVLYTYIIKAKDKDVPYGDELEIVELQSFPSWLTYTDNGDGTGTLTGTPTTGDVGTHHMVFEVDDYYHHSHNAVQQIFDIEVKNCILTAKAKDITVYLNSSGSATISGSDVDNGSSSTCGSVTLSVSPNTFGCVNSQILVSDNTWTESSYTENSGLCTSPNYWNGTSTLPAVSTYTVTPTIYAYATVLVPGTSGLYALNGVRYYRKTFNLTSISDIKATFLASVDNAVQIYVNGVAVALEGDLAYENFFDNTFSRIVLNSTGSNVNGGSGYQAFDNITGTSASSLFVAGTNEIVLAVANCESGDRGAISFKAIIESNGNGINPVVLTVSDGNGNTGTANATVTVLDTLYPTAKCKSIALTLVNGTATISASDINDGSSDNCGIASMWLSKTTFTCSDDGDNTVTLYVKDNAGNTSSCDATVTVDVITSASAGSNRVVYYGAPSAYSSATLVATRSGGSGYNYSWSNGATTQSNTVCPSTSTTYNLTITDNQGCSATSSVKVCSFDVRCGNKNDKVKVCHNTSSSKNPTNDICIASSAVADHMNNHGDKLGDCSGTYTCGGSGAAPLVGQDIDGYAVGTTPNFIAYPNPFSVASNVLFSVPTDQHVTISVYTLTGQLVSTLFNETSKANQAMLVSFNPGENVYGTFVIKMVTSEGKTYQSTIIRNR